MLNCTSESEYKLHETLEILFCSPRNYTFPVSASVFFNWPILCLLGLSFLPATRFHQHASITFSPISILSPSSSFITLQTLISSRFMTYFHSPLANKMTPSSPMYFVAVTVLTLHCFVYWQHSLELWKYMCVPMHTNMQWMHLHI